MKFIHFQPVFFDKIYKKGLGLPTKNHSLVASNSLDIIPVYFEFNVNETHDSHIGVTLKAY